MTKGRVLAVFAATIAIAASVFMVSTASAQYPPPKGGMFCASGQLVFKSGGTAVFSATIVDTTGAPVPGQLVNFAITAQSGGASLSNSSGVTDSKGMAFTTVNLGNNPGQLTVRAVNEGLQCSAVAEVQGAITAPKTGDAGLVAVGNGSGTSLLGLAAIGAIVFTVSGIVVARVRR